MSKNNVGEKALKAGIGYTIGNILVKGISFLSIPIFARLLTVTDYGIYNTFSSYVSILSVIIGFALHVSIKNANIDYKKKINEYCSSISLLILFNTVFLIIISFIGRREISSFLALEHDYFTILIVIESFGMMMITFYNSVLAIEYRYKEYLGVSLVFSVMGILLSVIFVVFLFPEQKYLGRILGTLISAVIIGLYIFYALYRLNKPTINIEYWKYGLKISLPIIPHGLSQIVLAQFDRLMIKKLTGSYDAGIYSFAYNIGTIFQVVVNSLDTAWAQWFFDQMYEKKYNKIKKVANLYAGLVAFFAWGLMLISPELITIMGGAKYNDSKYVALPIVLAMFYSYMYYFPSSVEYYYKKTKIIAVGTMIAASLNIILNAIFIPQYGYIAAAYTTVACYLVYYIMHMFFAYKIHGKNIFDNFIHISILIGLTVAMFFCQLIIDNVLLRYFVLGISIALFLIVVLKNKTKVLSMLSSNKE